MVRTWRILPARPTGAATRSNDAVPVAERLKVTQLLRLAAITLLLLCAVLAPDSLKPGLNEAVASTLGYAGLTAVAELARRFLRNRAGLVFSAMLLIDGIWLAVAMYYTGSLSSPVRFAIVLHLGAVALLASYRTSLRMAMWHSLLMLAAHAAQHVGGDDRTPFLPLTTPRLEFGPSDGQRLAVMITVLWLVVVLTAAISAFTERELRRHRRDLEVLTDLADSLERAVDSNNVARNLLDSVIDTFGFPRGVVLAGPEGQLPLLASYGLEEVTARRPGRPGRSEAVDEAHRTHASLFAPQLRPADEPWLSALLPDARNLVVVPLSAEGRPLGALVLEQADRDGGRIQPRVVSCLERSASYAAIALRNAWLLEQLQRLAATDGLTKIANRRTFESTLEREVARAARSAEQLSLVMVDIDQFKKLNDTHGHQAGDEVLRNVAAALSCECRDFDTAARYGGEEFAIVLPGCGADEAQDIAERLRRAVATAPSVVAITASAGVATFPVHAGDADTLVRAADNALYESKRSGRNRTTVSSGVPPEAQVDALLRRAVSQRLGRTLDPEGAPGVSVQSGLTDAPGSTSPMGAPAPRAGA